MNERATQIYSNNQVAGMRGVFLVAAELSKLGFIVSPTSRNANAADILVTDQKCKKTFSVQVKTNSRVFNFWLIGKKAREIVSDSHIYVLVNIRKTRLGEIVEHYVVPSKIVSQKMYYEGEWPNITREAVANFKDRWEIFGQAK